MNRDQLAHVVRAAARIARETNIVVIGSQAILGTFDESELPADATYSREVDIAFWDDDDESKSDAVDGAIGEGSQFDELNGYYAQGVSVTTAVLPDGWRERLIRFSNSSTKPGTAWCLEPHDLALAKLVAGREKDYQYVDALLKDGKLDSNLLESRCALMPVLPPDRRRLESWIRAQRRRFAP